MKNEKIKALFGGAAALPKGTGQNAPSASMSPETAEPAEMPAIHATSVAASSIAPNVPHASMRQDAVGEAPKAPVQQADAGSRQTSKQLAVICALAVVCGLAGGIAGGAAATAAGLGSSSSIGSSMNGGPGFAGGQNEMGMQGGMDGQGGMAQDGSPNDMDAVQQDDQQTQPDDPGAGANDDKTPDSGTDSEDASGNATAQATDGSNGEVYDA